MDQKTGFLKGEADAWFKRNQQAMDIKKSEEDLVLSSLASLAMTPKSILEIGCSTGWRLSHLEKRYTAHCCGVDPSNEGVEAGKKSFPTLDLRVATAERLPFNNNQFDLVIFGFCLYLCDRSDLFQIAAEADRVLSDGGHVVVYDFCTSKPYRNPYAHYPGLYAYKMDYAKMFGWNPAYKSIYSVVVSHNGKIKDNVPEDEAIGITVFQKILTQGFPDKCQI